MSQQQYQAEVMDELAEVDLRAMHKKNLYDMQMVEFYEYLFDYEREERLLRSAE